MIIFYLHSLNFIVSLHKRINKIHDKIKLSNDRKIQYKQVLTHVIYNQDIKIRQNGKTHFVIKTNHISKMNCLISLHQNTSQMKIRKNNKNHQIEKQETKKQQNAFENITLKSYIVT